MNKIITQLKIDAGMYTGSMQPDIAIDKFTELLIQEHIKILQKEWYNLNNDKDLMPIERSNGDIRFRAGQKAEIVVLIERIKQHFEVK